MMTFYEVLSPLTYSDSENGNSVTVLSEAEAGCVVRHEASAENIEMNLNT